MSARPSCDGASMRAGEIEPLLEVDVDEVIAADRAVERQRAAEDVDALQARHLARLRHQVLRDVFEIVELARELPEQISSTCE